MQLRDDEMSDDMIDVQQAEPVEPVLHDTDFTDELADEALDREQGARFCCGLTVSCCRPS